MGFRKGAKVAQIVPIITGTVVDFAVCREHGDVQYLVEWEDNGEIRSRYFHEDELEPAADGE